MDRDELRLHYQPIVTLQHGEVIGVEALIRWQHPRRGLIGPVEIIPAAESSGLIIDIGRWVLLTACRQMATWLAEHPDTAPRTISVNVSARQLREFTFTREVAAALTDNGLEPHRLTIEITESTAVGGGAPPDTHAGLSALGVRIAHDDFGPRPSTQTQLSASKPLPRASKPTPKPKACSLWATTELRATTSPDRCPPTTSLPCSPTTSTLCTTAPPDTLRPVR